MVSCQDGDHVGFEHIQVVLLGVEPNNWDRCYERVQMLHKRANPGFLARLMTFTTAKPAKLGHQLSARAVSFNLVSDSCM